MHVCVCVRQRRSGNGYGWTPTANEGTAFPRDGNEFGTRRYSGDGGREKGVYGTWTREYESRFSSILPETTGGFMIYPCTRRELYESESLTKNYGRSNYGGITNGASERFEELVGVTKNYAEWVLETSVRKGMQWYFMVILRGNDAGELRDGI